jgi:hypothetical protein
MVLAGLDILYLVCSFHITLAAVGSIEDNAAIVREGDAKRASNLIIQKNYIDPQNHCEGCTRIEYTPGSLREAGIAFRDKNNDLTDSQRIVLFARSVPAQQVSFLAVGNDSSSSIVANDTDKFPGIDFAIATENITLNNNWQRIEIPLNGTDLSNANYPLGIQLIANSSQKQVLYIKGVSADKGEAVNPILLAYDSQNSSSVNSANLTNSSGTELKVRIEANSSSGETPVTMEFIANATGGVFPYFFDWTLASSNETYLGKGETIQHTFNQSGQYVIRLAAKDSSDPPQNASAFKVVNITTFINETDSGSFGTRINATINNSAPNNLTINTTTLANTANNLTKNSTVNSHSLSPPIDATRNNLIDNNSIQQEGKSNFKIANITESLSSSNIGQSGSLNSENIEENRSKINKLDNQVTPEEQNATVKVTMPVQENINVATVDNSPISIELKSSLPSEKTPFKISITSNPKHGRLDDLSLIDKTSAKVTYIPTLGFSGKDEFEFKIQSQESDATAVGRVSVTVISSPPSGKYNGILEGKDQTIFSQENKKVIIKLRSNDEENEIVNFNLTSTPSHGKIASFNPSTGMLTYRPDKGFVGQDSFTFSIADEHGAKSNSARVSVVIGTKAPGNEFGGKGASVGSQDTTPPSQEKDSHLVDHVNHKPSADAGPDQILKDTDKPISLKGSGKDPDGDKLSYLWKQTFGPAVKPISPLDEPNVLLNASKIFGGEILKFVLSVNDGNGGQDLDSVNIRVIDDGKTPDSQKQDRIQKEEITNQTTSREN